MAHDFGAGRQPRSLSARGADTRLPHKPKPNFFFKHHPYRWELVGDEWLPQLGRLPQELGCNGVDEHGEMHLAVAEQARQGWQIIPHDVIEGGYVRVHDCQQGELHLSRWETPQVVGGRKVPSKVDVEGYYAFVRGLVERGIIAPPHPSIIEGKIADIRRHTETILASDANERQATIARDELARAERATVPQPPAPPTPRTRKKRAAA